MNQKNPQSERSYPERLKMIVNRKINFLILMSLVMYVAGLSFYVWGGYRYFSIESWDRFYFLNESFLKVIIPLFVSLILSYKPFRIIFGTLSLFQFLLFLFNILKFFGYSNLVLYKCAIFVYALTLIIIIYVSSKRFS